MNDLYEEYDLEYYESDVPIFEINNRNVDKPMKISRKRCTRNSFQSLFPC